MPNFQFLLLIWSIHYDFDSGYFLFFVGVELEKREDSGKWSSYQYVGGAGSVMPTASLAGTHVSVDEIRSAAAVSSSSYYPPSLHGALVGSPEPDPTPGVCALVMLDSHFNYDHCHCFKLRLWSQFHCNS